MAYKWYRYSGLTSLERLEIEEEWLKQTEFTSQSKYWEHYRKTKFKKIYDKLKARQEKMGLINRNIYKD